MAKKRNPTDATLRNVRATDRKVGQARGVLERRLARLEARVKALEAQAR